MSDSTFKVGDRVSVRTGLANVPYQGYAGPVVVVNHDHPLPFGVRILTRDGNEIVRYYSRGELHPLEELTGPRFTISQDGDLSIQGVVAGAITSDKIKAGQVRIVDDLGNRFGFHPALTDERKAAHGRVRDDLLAQARVLDEELPAGREKSLALTKLEEVMFWANASIARQAD